MSKCCCDNSSLPTVNPFQEICRFSYYALVDSSNAVSVVNDLVESGVLGTRGVIQRPVKGDLPEEIKQIADKDDLKTTLFDQIQQALLSAEGPVYVVLNGGISSNEWNGLIEYYALDGTSLSIDSLQKARATFCSSLVNKIYYDVSNCVFNLRENYVRVFNRYPQGYEWIEELWQHVNQKTQHLFNNNPHIHLTPFSSYTSLYTDDVSDSVRYMNGKDIIYKMKVRLGDELTVFRQEDGKIKFPPVRIFNADYSYYWSEQNQITNQPEYSEWLRDNLPPEERGLIVGLAFPDGRYASGFINNERKYFVLKSDKVDEFLNFGFHTRSADAQLTGVSDVELSTVQDFLNEHSIDSATKYFRDYQNTYEEYTTTAIPYDFSLRGNTGGELCIGIEDMSCYPRIPNPVSAPINAEDFWKRLNVLSQDGTPKNFVESKNAVLAAYPAGAEVVTHLNAEAYYFSDTGGVSTNGDSATVSSYGIRSVDRTAGVLQLDNMPIILPVDNWNASVALQGGYSVTFNYQKVVLQAYVDANYDPHNRMYKTVKVYYTNDIDRLNAHLGRQGILLTSSCLPPREFAFFTVRGGFTAPHYMEFVERNVNIRTSTIEDGDGGTTTIYHNVLTLAVAEEAGGSIEKQYSRFVGKFATDKQRVDTALEAAFIPTSSGRNADYYLTQNPAALAAVKAAYPDIDLVPANFTFFYKSDATTMEERTREDKTATVYIRQYENTSPNRVVDVAHGDMNVWYMRSFADIFGGSLLSGNLDKYQAWERNAPSRPGWGVKFIDPADVGL